MYASHAGRISVQDKTRMHLDDVLDLLSSGKVIHLGVSGNGREFMLFYSPNDNDGRVAVVNDDGKCLISVMEPTEKLPYRVTVPSNRLTIKAKRLVKEFCFERLKQEFPNSEKKEFKVQIRLYYGNKTIYETKISKPNSGENPKDDKKVILFFRDELERIVKAVEEESKNPKEMRYLISSFDHNSGLLRKSGIMVHHGTLVRYLSEPRVGGL